MNLKKYWEITRVSFRESVAYRLNAITSLAGSILFIVMYFYIWKAIGASGQLASSLTEIMTYIVVGQVVSNTAFVNVEEFFADPIRRGTIVNELKRPVTMFSQAYFDKVGEILFNMFAKSVPIAVMGILFFSVSLPGASAGLSFLLSLFLSFNLVFLLSYATSMTIFWTKTEWSVKSMRRHIQKIFSGILFPLYLVPDQFQLIFNILPFRAMVDGPIRIFTGTATGNQILQIISVQLAWILILYLLAYVSWRKARTKLTVQGG